MEAKTAIFNGTTNTLDKLRRLPKITMPTKPRTTIVPAEEVANTVRKLEEYTDYPIETTGGRKLIRRVEKIRMPNGRYRYPVTYIDMTPDFRTISREEWEASRIPGHPVIKLAL